MPDCFERPMVASAVSGAAAAGAMRRRTVRRFRVDCCGYSAASGEARSKEVGGSGGSIRYKAAALVLIWQLFASAHKSAAEKLVCM